MTEWQAGPLPGVAERYFPGEGNNFHRERVQDAAPIIENAKRIRNDLDGRTPGGMRYLGQIPITLYHEWIAEWTAKGDIGPGNMDRLNDLLIKRLRDSEYSKLRCTDGRF